MQTENKTQFDPAVARLKRSIDVACVLKSRQSSSFEHLIMRLATAFVNMPLDRMDKMIDQALLLTGEEAGVDRSYLMSYDFEKQIVCNTHEWCEDGVEPMISLLQEVPFEGLEVFTNAHKEGEVLLVRRVADLNVGSALRELLEPQGIITMVAVPLMDDGKCLGFVGFDAVREHKDWSEREIELLWILAEVFINAERARRRERALVDAIRQAERAERRLQRAVMAGQFALWERDLLSDELQYVCGWNRLMGREDLDGRRLPVGSFFEMVLTEQLPKLNDRLVESKLKPGCQFEVDFQMVDTLGRLMDVRGKWVVDHEDGVAVRAIGSVENITVLVQRESEMRKQAEVEAVANRIESRFSVGRSFDEALKKGFGECLAVTRLDRISLLTVVEGGKRLRVHQSLGERIEDESLVRSNDFPSISLSQLKALCTNGRLRIDLDVECESGLVNWLAESGAAWAMVFPILGDGQLEGLLTVECHQRWLVPTLMDEYLLRVFSQIIAGAILRNRMDQELRDNREFYSTILQSLGEAVIVTTMEGKIVFANRAWMAITQSSLEASMNVRLMDLVHFEDVQIETVAQQQTLDGTLKAPYSLRLVVDRMGSYRWFLVMKKILKVPILQGANGFLITLQDDTERHEWEDRLISAKVRAENQSEAKTLYFSKASHELRTPLHGILSILELLQQTNLSNEQRRLAGAAESSAQSLKGVFDDVLEVSKLESGVVKLKVKPVRLDILLENVMALFMSDAQKKGLSLTWRLAETVPLVVNVDKMRVRQVLINLVSNAVKYTQEGGVEVLVELTGKGDDNQFWLDIAVKDTGGGIPENDREKLFIPFMRLESHSQMAGEGSGLGLPIVKELCRLMGAELQVHSDGRTGTTMHFILPAQSQPEQLPVGLSTPRPFEPSLVLKGKRALVVEDNEISRYVAAQHLAELGATVRVAENGVAALAIFTEEPQDFVLMDCALPLMNGFEAASRIRASPSQNGGDCIIIACTADCSIENSRRCLSVGMNGVLAKPYARQQLLSIINQVMAGVVGVQRVRKESAAVADLVIPIELQSAAPIRLELIGVQEDLRKESESTRRFLLKAFDLFAESVPSEVDLICEAMQQGDLEGLAKRLHHLKSSAAAVGAEQLSVCCKWQEEMLAGSRNGVTLCRQKNDCIEQLEQVVARCLRRMMELQHQLKPTG